MTNEKIVTKKDEVNYLEQLKKDFAVNDKKGEINSINELLGKKLNTRAYVTYWLNMVTFIILCLGVFLFLVSPAIMWILGHGPGTETFSQKFKIVVVIGLVFVVAAALYGGLVFWVLLVKCIHLNHDGHKIHLYLGARIIVLCVDERIVAYCKYGWFTVPPASWCAKLDEDQMIRFQIFKKNEYTLDVNWYTESSYEKYIEERYTINGKDQKLKKRKDFVKEIVF